MGLRNLAENQARAFKKGILRKRDERVNRLWAKSCFTPTLMTIPCICTRHPADSSGSMVNPLWTIDWTGRLSISGPDIGEATALA